MVEARQTIIERVARFVMELVGAEEVEERIEALDADMLNFAKNLRANKEEMTALSQAFKEMGVTISRTTLQQLPQTVNFLYEYGKAMSALPEGMHEVSVAEWALSDAGREAAISTGLVTKSMIEGEEKARGLKDSFWDLNSAARALLRIFVSFKILVGTLSIFKEMADASFNLQAELWRLRAVIEGVSAQMEGGAGTWDEWLARLDRLRAMLPLINMTELITGMRTLTGILGPLGLTANEIERVTGLVGQMATLMGRDFPSYMNLFIGALGGAQRSVGPMGVDLRDGNRALHEYAEGLGFVWDELNAGQRQWVRLGFFVQEAITRTEGITDAITEEWQELEKLRKKREDILAQSPELIGAQIAWAEFLVIVAEKAKILVGVLTDAVNTAYQLIYISLYLTKGQEEFAKIWKAHQEAIETEKILEWIAGIKEPWQEMGEVIEDFDETVKENVAALADAEDAFDEFGDAISRAMNQARDALRSYQQSVEQAAISLSRRLADIVRNLQERLADLESRFELRRAQLLARFEEQRAELKEEGAEREEELREDLNKRLRRMEEDHLLDMQELREDYLLDLEEAARSRDAVSMRRIQQRYILEKKQREREYDVSHRRAIEDYKEQLDELKRAREEQERELEESLERQLRELQENYEQQQEEARLNAERQREDALRNYQEQLTDLWQNFQDRLEAIALNLIEEEKEWKDAFEDLRAFFDEWYEDDLTALKVWLAKRALLLRTQEWIESMPSWMRDLIPPLSFSMAQGGMGVARSPTQITVGESGPEIFAAWPLGQRMPRAGIDIRLTIDGTQGGAWSADFENQTLRILREVLQEAL